MKQQNKPTIDASYLIGFGLGTGLSPLLISIFGVTLPTSAQYKVWGVGVIIFLAGMFFDYRAKKSAS